MGYQGNGFALVSMTNKDVYYVTQDVAKQLMDLISSQVGRQPVAFFETTDAKSGARIAIALSNISSIVVPKEGGNRG